MQQRAYDMLVITHLVVCAGLFGSTNFGPTSRTPVLSLPPPLPFLAAASEWK